VAAIVVRARISERRTLEDGFAARLLALSFSLLLIGFGVGGILHLYGDPDESWKTARIAYLLFGGIATGACIYAAGVILWKGRRALLLRIGGWCFLAAPAAVPSTFTLYFPFVAALILTLVEVPRRAQRAHPGLERKTSPM
jgi:hypothetical protein